MSNSLSITYSYSNDVYVMVYRTADSYVWDTVSEAFVVENTANWTRYAIAMTEISADRYAADMPEASAANYYAIYREQAGSNPATTDLILSTESFYWNGTSQSEDPGEVTPPTLSQYCPVDLNMIKRYLNLDYNDTSKNYLLTDLANIAISKFEKITGRFAYKRDHRVTVNTNGHSIILLHFPIKKIYRVAGERANGIKLTHSGSDLRVSVSCNGDYLTFNKIDVNGLESDNNISLAIYKTTSQIVDYINANITNVTATLVKNAPSKDIWAFVGYSIKNTSQYVEIINDDTIAYRLDTTKGALKLDWSPYDTVMVEYEAGFDSSNSEWYYLQAILLEAIHLMYSMVGKDAALASKQSDQDENFQTVNYINHNQIDKFIEYKCGQFKDPPLAS